MKNGYIRHVLYLRNSIWSWFLVHLCKMVISPSVFFNFFKILFFGIVTGVKWQKIAQNHNKLCLSRFISQEHHTSYDCHLWYTCAKWWYLHVFFFHLFKILIFWVVSGWGLKGREIVQNDKNCVCRALYLRNHTSYNYHLWYTSVKWWYLLECFSVFQNFNFSGC